jgi:hypothetical protein
MKVIHEGVDILLGWDGNQRFAIKKDFVDLQVSNCGFGDTNQLAIDDLLMQEEKP